MATDANRSEVIQFLYRHRDATRTDIHTQTGMTPATVSQVVTQLIAANVVTETGEEVAKTPGSGRKQKVLSLVAAQATLIGVAFTLDGIDAVVSDSLGQSLASTSEPYAYIQKNGINQAVVSVVQTLLKQYSGSVNGVGLAIPGHYDSENHTLISNNLMWQDFDLGVIHDALKLPIVAENNIESMALANLLFDAPVSPDKFLFMHAGYGLYCAFIEPSHLHPKRNYAIGEIGHTVVDPQGMQCECGKHGCLQTYISDTWLVKRAKLLFERSPLSVLHSLVTTASEITMQTVLDAYALGDRYIIQMLEQGISYLAISVANLMMMNDADAIFLNSRLLQQPEFGDKIQHLIADQLQFIPSKKNTAVHILPYRDIRGARGGAALVALTRVIENPAYQSICLD